MRWRLGQETVEEPDHTLHRPGCPKIDAVELVTHPAGTVLERTEAPRECWSCLPDVEMALGL